MNAINQTRDDPAAARAGAAKADLKAHEAAWRIGPTTTSRPVTLPPVRQPSPTRFWPCLATGVSAVGFLALSARAWGGLFWWQVLVVGLAWLAVFLVVRLIVK